MLEHPARIWYQPSLNCGKHGKGSGFQKLGLATQQKKSAGEHCIPVIMGKPLHCNDSIDAISISTRAKNTIAN
jgi:hypothetical protein